MIFNGHLKVVCVNAFSSSIIVEEEVKEDTPEGTKTIALQ